MTLRTRLLLVILVVLLPTIIASLVTASISRSIQEDIGELRRDAEVPLRTDEIVGTTLELEFSTAPGEIRRVTRIVRLSRERRPKLRGQIESTDPTTGSITVLGIPIYRGTPNAESREENDPNASILRVGMRVEISAAVASDGRWIARKIKTDGLKPDEKLKGTITTATKRADGTTVLEFSGYKFEIPPGIPLQIPRGPLARHEAASRMGTAAQECLALAHDLMLASHLRRDARGDVERAQKKLEIELLRTKIADSLDDLQTYLAELITDAATEIEFATLAEDTHRRELEVQRRHDVITPLIVSVQTLQGGINDAIASPPDTLRAAELLGERLESDARKKLLPMLRAIELEAEESLKSELKLIAQQAQAATRLTIATTVVGVVLALGVAFFLTRTITRPVVELDAAALRIGSGDLNARVSIQRDDEIGHLGATFNRMAERLEASTISIGNLSDVIESLAGGLFIVAPDGTISSPNAAFLSMLGYDRIELEGAPTSMIEASLKSVESCRGVEHHFKRKDGSLVPVSFSAAPLGKSADRGFVCLAEDLSVRKSMEAALRDSVQEKDLLLRELHHRVKNNLQVITSLLDLQSREIKDPKALEKFQDSQDRIRSMALIHEQLFGAQDLGLVDLRTYLGLLIANLEQSHVDPPGRITVSAVIDELRLDLDRALACGLIVNELVTNAIKHAFPRSESGTIVVTCTKQGANFVLEVRDDGQGLRAANFANSETLGQSLVRDLASQLRGTVRVGSGTGAEFVLTFPYDKSNA